MLTLPLKMGNLWAKIVNFPIFSIKDRANHHNLVLEIKFRIIKKYPNAKALALNEKKRFLINHPLMFNTNLQVCVEHHHHLRCGIHVNTNWSFLYKMKMLLKSIICVSHVRSSQNKLKKGKQIFSNGQF